ncbi:MAG: RNA methyltransferase [Thiolinea sp.]
MNPLLDRLSIVMIQTSHPGNIGSAARAMKTMGISDLRLVQPNKFNSPEVRALASGADSILDAAQHYDSLSAAIADCHCVIGTSARQQRHLRWPQLDARACGQLVAERPPAQRIALLFGRERSGLSNEELEHCHYLAHVPMAYDYFSLNIAAAIQLFCYECMMATQAAPAASASVHTPDSEHPDEGPASGAELDAFYQHLETTLTEVRYLDPDNPRLLMRRLRRLFSRAEPSRNEVNMLRGMLAAFQGRKFQRRSS